jgi:hypothetical protein
VCRGLHDAHEFHTEHTELCSFETAGSFWVSVNFDGRNSNDLVVVYKVLVGKPEGKRPLGRPRRRWEDGIRMDLMVSGLGVGGGGLDSTGSGQGPVAGCSECGDEPSGSCVTELV